MLTNDIVSFEQPGPGGQSRVGILFYTTSSMQTLLSMKYFILKFVCSGKDGIN